MVMKAEWLWWGKVITYKYRSLWQSGVSGRYRSMAAAEVVVLVATVAVAAAAVVTIHDRIKAGVHIVAPFSISSSLPPLLAHFPPPMFHSFFPTTFSVLGSSVF